MFAVHSIAIGYILEALRYINAPNNVASQWQKDPSSMESKMQFWSSLRNLGID